MASTASPGFSGEPEWLRLNLGEWRGVGLTPSTCWTSGSDNRERDLGLCDRTVGVSCGSRTYDIIGVYQYRLGSTRYVLVERDECDGITYKIISKLYRNRIIRTHRLLEALMSVNVMVTSKLSNTQHAHLTARRIEIYVLILFILKKDKYIHTPVMTPEPFTCNLDVDTKTSLKLYLFTNVQNVEDIRNNIVKGVWNCTAIKPRLILDKFQVIVAANCAVVAEKTGTMYTRSVYAEILYNLSLTKSISLSLSKFGVEKDNSLLICFLVTPEKDDSEGILSQIDGEMCSISDIDRFTDMEEVKAAYKLNNLKCNVDLLDMIVSRMVTKNFVSH